MAKPLIILNTNVVSEFLRPAPAEVLEQWLASQDGSCSYLTTISEAELRHGVALLPAGRRRTALAKAIDGILDEEFRGRILPFDSAAARAYAAIARAHGGAVATRNTTDFGHCGIDVINPWGFTPQA